MNSEKKKKLSFIIPDGSKLIDEKDVYKYISIHLVLLIGLSFLIIFGIQALIVKNYIMVAADFGWAFILISTIFYLRKTKNYQIAITIAIIAISFLYFFLLFSAVMGEGGTLWLYTYPLLLFLLLGKKNGSIVVSSFFFVIILGLLVFHFGDYSNSFNFRYVGSMAAVTIIAYFYEKLREQSEQSIKNKNATLETTIQTLHEKEEQLRLNEIRYRTIFEHSGTAIISFGDDRIIRMCNTKFEELIGLRRDQIIDKVEWSDYISDEDINKLMEYHKLRSEGKDAPSSYDFRMKDSRGQEHSVYMNIVIDPNNMRIASLIDLSKEKRMEQIQTILYRISSAVNTSGELSELIEFIRIELGQLIDTHNFYVAMYDKDKHELTLPFLLDEKDSFQTFPAGKTLTAYVIQQKKSMLLPITKVKELTENGIVDSVGTPSKVWLGCPLIVNNEVIGVIAVQDYTNENAYNESHKELLEFVSGQIALALERKQSDVALRREKAYLQKLFNSAPEGVVLANNDSVVLRINKGFTEIFGYNEEEVLGKPIDDILTTPELRMEASHLTNDVSEGNVVNFESKRLHKSGKLIDVSIVGTPIYGDEEDDQIAVYGIYRDITKRKEIEAEIAKKREYLKLINKILRHDLMNNLSVIRSAIKLFGRTDEKDFLHKASDTVKKSVDLITKMRELEKLTDTEDRLQEYDVQKIISKLKRVYRQISIEVNGNCIVLANDAIQSVFDNIISNAINHGKTDKMIINVIPKDSTCEIEFIDFGKGIPDEVKGKIFDENFKYGDTGNTGLGLFIVKKAVDVFHGKIFVENNEPKGTIFRLVLQK